LVELCGLPVPEGLEGTSFVPLLSDPDRPWKRAAFSTCAGNGSDDGRVPMGRMARTERWQYNRWGYTGQEELYDMAADPDQLINLAQDPEHSAELATMRQILDEGWKSCQPEGQ
jgi:iduronate 2-sulfatase